MLPVFVTVAHRMIPFFTSSALQQQEVPHPFWPWTMLAASLVHGAMEFFNLTVWLWLACFGPWVWRYLPAYWRPRADGQPG